MPAALPDLGGGLWIELAPGLAAAFNQPASLGPPGSPATAPELPQHCLVVMVLFHHLPVHAGCHCHHLPDPCLVAGWDPLLYSLQPHQLSQPFFLLGSCLFGWGCQPSICDLTHSCAAWRHRCLVKYHIIYHIISYTISYHIICHIICHIISYTISCHIIHHIINYAMYHIISYHIISYTISCHVLSQPGAAAGGSWSPHLSGSSLLRSSLLT